MQLDTPDTRIEKHYVTTYSIFRSQNSISLGTSHTFLGTKQPRHFLFNPPHFLAQITECLLVDSQIEPPIFTGKLSIVDAECRSSNYFMIFYELPSTSKVCLVVFQSPSKPPTPCQLSYHKSHLNPNCVVYSPFFHVLMLRYNFSHLAV